MKKLQAKWSILNAKSKINLVEGEEKSLNKTSTKWPILKTQNKPRERRQKPRERRQEERNKNFKPNGHFAKLKAK